MKPIPKSDFDKQYPPVKWNKTGTFLVYRTFDANGKVIYVSIPD